MSAFLVMLREGVEAALIVAILLAYLRRTNRPDAARMVWYGTLGAVAISLVAGSILYATVGGLHGNVEYVVEGLIAIGAAAVLTWMIFWMARQARGMRGALESRVDSVLATGSVFGLASVAFFAVLREGLESALFMMSTTVGDEANATQVIGGLIGVTIAAFIGYLVYRGGRTINLRLFFRITGAAILLFAAGLVSTGIHELQEAGLFPIINEHLWTLPAADPDGSTFWLFMKSLFGWRHSPSLLMVAGYFAYLIPVGWRFFTMSGSPKATPEAAQVSSSTLS